MHGKGLTILGCIIYMWISSIQAADHQSSESRCCSIYKPPSHPQGGMGCDTRYKLPYMGCHPFHMFHGCMEKVSHAWGVTHTRACPISRPQTTKAVGQDFVEFCKICKTTMPSSWWCVLLYETIWHRGVTTYPTCLVGTCTRSDKPMTQSMRWYAIHPSHRIPKLCDQIWQDLQNHHTTIMVVCVVTWTPIPYILSVHGKGPRSLGHNKWTEFLPNQATY